jgi:hypothetical protein
MVKLSAVYMGMRRNGHVSIQRKTQPTVRCFLRRCCRVRALTVFASAGGGCTTPPPLTLSATHLSSSAGTNCLSLPGVQLASCQRGACRIDACIPGLVLSESLEGCLTSRFGLSDDTDEEDLPFCDEIEVDVALIDDAEYTVVDVVNFGLH